MTDSSSVFTQQCEALLDIESSTVADTLARALLTFVDVDFVYICLMSVAIGPPIEAVASNEEPSCSAGQAMDLAKKLLSEQPSLVDGKSEISHADNIRHAVVPLGHEGLEGRILAASHRTDFPSAWDMLKLRIFANHAQYAIQASQRRSFGFAKAEALSKAAEPGVLEPVQSNGNHEEHWHVDILQMTSHGIQVQGTVIPAKSITSRYRMGPDELKACLKQLGWTQEKLANTFHVSRSTVKKWAQGRTKIPGPAIVLLKLMLQNSAYLHTHASTALPESTR